MDTGGGGGKDHKEDGDKDKRRKRGVRNVRKLQRCPFCEKDNPDHFPVRCPSVECFNCGEPGHVQGECGKLMCHWCGEEGHVNATCPYHRRSGSNAPSASATADPTSADGNVPVSQGPSSIPAPVRAARRATTTSSSVSFASVVASRPAGSKRPAVSAAAASPVSVSGYVKRMRDDFVGLVNSMNGIRDSLAKLDRDEEALEVAYQRRKRELADERQKLQQELEMSGRINTDLSSMVNFLRGVGVQVPETVVSSIQAACGVHQPGTSQGTEVETPAAVVSDSDPVSSEPVLPPSGHSPTRGSESPVVQQGATGQYDGLPGGGCAPGHAPAAATETA